MAEEQPKLLGVEVDYLPPPEAMITGVIGAVTFLDGDGDLCVWSFRSTTMPDHEALGLIESLRLEVQTDLTTRMFYSPIVDDDDE